MSAADDQKVSLGGYVALGFAVVFFSGLLKSNEWYGVFDFTTLNGAFGKLLNGVAEGGEGTIVSTATSYRGTGGSGALDGFLFALGLVPTCMFALGMINVLEHFGALRAARKLLTPLLRPLMGVPGTVGLALIGSLQSTDVGAGMTKGLADDNELTEDEKNTFTAFQFSGGAMIVNFFSSGAILFTLTDAAGNSVPGSIGLCVAVMFLFKVFGANVMRFYLKFASKKTETNTRLEAQNV